LETLFESCQSELKIVELRTGQVDGSERQTVSLGCRNNPAIRNSELENRNGIAFGC